MAKERILVIEDEADIRELIRFNLEREGYAVSVAPSGEAGLEAARANPPQIILLDLMLPGIDGLEVCKILKNDQTTKQAAIVMLSAKGEEADIVSGLELGADDYITKPFSPRVVLARLKAVLRRKSTVLAGIDDILTFDDLTIAPGRREVIANAELVSLTNTEFRLLHALATRPGWVFTRYQIVNAVRGSDVIVTDRSVDVQIVGLRKKLGKSGKHIETVRGVGYRFRE
ncbi:MAG: response regulator transcription factor [candidate division Zixibacteria bacterium]|nr:response regulator transcription factor [candidate division Zixibacteria bacterium]